ncbi:MAG: hypothetical protein JSV05_07335 [Candidatus Bathyarchaeota archaeon]|nr:MAG: hypothetical protein JSV05_07335 [Candidatus Bathyarchaeota archaeon]
MFIRKAVSFSLILFVLVLFCVKIGHSIDSVPIEFLWFEPCAVCPGFEEDYQIFLHNRQVIFDLESDYGSEITVEWIEFYSPEGLEKQEQYNLNVTDWNTIVVNYEAVFRGFANETEMRVLIDEYLRPAPIHDIAILHVVASNTSIQIGEPLHINVTIKNEGNQIESCNVTTFFNSNIIQTLLVENLEPNTERLLEYHWDTQNVLEGNYSISAQASLVQNETDTEDNSLSYGLVEVRAPFTPPTIIHDVAILSISLSLTTVNVGEQVPITVIVRNNGTATESLNVSAYHGNQFLIGMMPVCNLSPKTEVSLIFKWDTINQTTGNYTITAWAMPVADETNLENNWFFFGDIEILALPSQDLAALFVVAFSFGFFETLSPCLIIMLSFILSFTIGETTKFKESFTKVMLFGIGFVSAAAILGLAAALVFLSLPTLQTSLTLTVCVFAIIFGLNLVGLLKVPFKTKPILQKLARRHAITLAGILILGFIFYFLDPCIAPIFISMVRLEPALFGNLLPLTLSIFAIGAIIPFIGIGVFAGSISKMAREAYKHRFKIRAISGLILIGYAIYLIIFIIF